MPRVSIATLEKSVLVPSPLGVGEVESRAMLSRRTDPIHLTLHRLGPQAGVTLSGDVSDLALFVWRGSVEAAGMVLDESASAIVEYGAALPLLAGSDGALVVAFNRSERTSGAPSAGKVHILPSDRVPRSDCLGGKIGIGGALHADAACPTCSVWLHENSYAMAGRETIVHSHTEDEVIFVHSGSIRLGNRLYGPGTALAVAAHTKYGFFSGPDGLGFVNFRGSAPTYVSGDGKTVMDERELFRGLLGHPVYV